MSVKPSSLFYSLSAFLLACSLATPSLARDASFVDPTLSATSKNSTEDAVTVEPKAEIDAGESVINNARRVSLYFVNQTGAQVELTNVGVSADGNVVSTIVTDDCSKEGKIAPSSRCAVIVSLTPTSPGAWAAEVTLTHKGVGRIARSKIIGKAISLQSMSDKKDSSLALSSKEVSPVTFGDVELGSNKAVRSALMVNDSNEAITLLSIDLIAAENGLSRLDQGCAVDMDLKPGESCPITLAWKPTAKSSVFTDLIVRHSGRAGFIVVPVRGNTKEGGEASSVAKEAAGKTRNVNDKIPLPPTAEELERITGGKLPSLNEDDVKRATAASAASAVNDKFHLIGTVGSRAVLLKPDGTTTVVGVGEEMNYADKKSARLSRVGSKDADIYVVGKLQHLELEESNDLVSKGVSGRRTAGSSGGSSSDSSGGKGGSSSSGRSSK